MKWWWRRWSGLGREKLKKFSKHKITADEDDRTHNVTLFFGGSNKIENKWRVEAVGDFKKISKKKNNLFDYCSSEMVENIEATQRAILLFHNQTIFAQFKNFNWMNWMIWLSHNLIYSIKTKTNLKKIKRDEMQTFDTRNFETQQIPTKTFRNCLQK